MCSGYLSPKSLIKGTKALSRFQRKTWTEGLAGANSAQGALPNPGAPSPGPPKGVQGRGVGVGGWVSWGAGSECEVGMAS